MTDGERKRGEKEKKMFYESHRKHYGGCKGEQINPLTVQRNA